MNKNDTLETAVGKLQIISDGHNRVDQHTAKAISSDGLIRIVKSVSTSADRSTIARFNHQYLLIKRLLFEGFRDIQIPLCRGTTSAEHYIVFKYYDASSLWFMFEDHNASFPPKVDDLMIAFLKILANVAQVVADLHGHYIAHGDIKPENFLYSGENGRIMMIDLDNAIEVGGDVINPDLVIGTLQYISPEHLTGRENVCRESDVYALGVMMYRLLTGRKPYTLDDNPTCEDVYKHQRDFAEDGRNHPCIVNTEVHPRLSDLTIRAMSLKKKDRPSAQQFADELREIIQRSYSKIVPREIILAPL